MKTAIIIGATGLTGSILLKKLLDDPRYKKVKLFSRSSVNFTHQKLEEYLIDMLALKNAVEDFTADEVFCCIGTTNAKTPNKELYRKIDFGIPVTVAQLCKRNNIKSLIIISALGANSKSSIFYNRIKGEMEDQVLQLKIQKTHILQPSLIGGKRGEKRAGEYFFKQIMKVINPLLFGSLKKYRSIDPKNIVITMIWLANNIFHKKKILSDEIKKISDKM